MPLLFFIAGIYLTAITRGFVLGRFGTIVKNTIMKIAEARKEAGPGILSQFAAWATATGATIGMGNIAGVSSAIAIGGPGAVFWMWIAALVGMTIKMSEVVLGIRYRDLLPDGRAYGGPPWYIKKGLGLERKWPDWAWKALALTFTITFLSTAFISMSNYTIMEGAMTSFNLSKEAAVIIGFVYASIVALISLGFIPRAARAAEILMPLMVALYLGGALGILIAYANNIPTAFAQIFGYAFTPAAAVGGFAGATVAKAIQVGVARAVYSNEAGWGSAPHIHATAKVDHPVRQGMWGAMEVFLDTIIVCSATALVVVTSGVWQTGIGGVTAVLQAFKSVYGPAAPILLYSSLFIFVLTTSTGWYTYYEVEARFWLSDRPKVLNALIRFLQVGSPFIIWIVGALALLYGVVPAVFWILGDITSGIPVYINLIVLLILSPVVAKEVKEFEEKYLSRKG